MTTTTEIITCLANLASSIAEIGAANVHDCNELRDASRAVLRECGIRPTGRIKAARELKVVADALSGLEMIGAYVEGSDADASGQALLELEAARTSLARRVESLCAIVCQPLVRPHP